MDKVQHVFDSYCRRVMKNAANDYYSEVLRRNRYEVLLEDCWDTPAYIDHYSVGTQTYYVFGEVVAIENFAVAEALNTLSPENRLIVLATCCVGLADRVVADYLHMVRRTVAYRKAKTLKELRRLLCNV